MHTHNRYAQLLIITHESIGEKMAGPGIRAWEIAAALGQQGVPVMLASPFIGDRHAPNVRLQEFNWDDPNTLESLIRQAEVIMAAGPVIARVIYTLQSALDQPTIVDIYDVAEIERIMLNDFHATPLIIDELFSYLRQGDLFICASERQYDFWLGALLAAGRLNTATLGSDFSVERLIQVVPFGIPEQSPAVGDVPVMKGVIPGITPDDKVIFWGGGIWDWTDPFTLMHALEILLSTRDDIRIVFAARRHFDNTIVPEMSVVSQLMNYLTERNWIDRYVFFLDWIPYDQRGAYLLEADMGVSLFKRAIENRYAIRSRLFDHLWAGCPCIVSEGDDMAQILAQIGLARVVQPGDVDGVVKAIKATLDHPLDTPNELYQDRAKQMRWTISVRPILNFLREQYHAPDASNARQNIDIVSPLRRECLSLRDQIDQLESAMYTLQEERNTLQETVEIYRNRKVVRIADFIGRRLKRVN